MTDLRICWAYNVSGVRCDMPAGHPGDHSVTTTWTDDECATPGELVTIVAPSNVTVLPAAAPPAPPEREEPCVACGHQRASHSEEGPCAAMVNHGDGPESCTCFAFI